MGYIDKVWHEQPELVLGCIILVFFGILLLVSNNAREQFKSLFLLLIGLVGIAVAYHFVTGNSVADIPQQIDTFFNTERAPETTSHRYYSDPLEGAPESLRDDD